MKFRLSFILLLASIGIFPSTAYANLQEMWGNNIEEGNPPVVICEAVYRALSEEKYVELTTGNLKPLQSEAQRDERLKNIELRFKSAKYPEYYLPEGEKESLADVIRKSIRYSFGPMTGDLLNQERARQANLREIANACDELHGRVPKNSLKLQMVSHQQCAVRYFALASGLRGSNPQFSGVFHQRALFAAGQKTKAYEKRVGTPFTNHQELNANIEKSAREMLSKAMQDKNEQRIMYVKARDCDKQYNLELTPIPQQEDDRRNR